MPGQTQNDPTSFEERGCPPDGSSSVSLRLADPLKDAEWESLLSRCCNSSFFYSSAWARVLAETYGYQPCYFIANRTGPIAFPWMEVKSWLSGRRAISLPFTDICSTKNVSPEDFRRAVNDITQRGLAARWKYWEFRGGSELVPDAPPSTVFLNHQLTLDNGEELTFSRFNSTTRTAIRKAESAGVEVEITCSFEGVEAFYQLLCRTRKRHGAPPQPFAFFANLYRYVLQHGHGAIGLARVAGRPAAGVFFLHRGKEVIYKYAASDERLQQFRASNLVLWRAIQHYIKRGAACLDFGRTSLANLGLQRFKLAWGAEERRVGYIRYDFRARAFTTVNDQASGWHTRVFRHLPTAAGQLVGRFLYRHAA